MAVTDVLSGPLPESTHRSQLTRAVIASSVGTTIEWYDFLLYSVVTGLVFGKLFFPTPSRWSACSKHSRSMRWAFLRARSARQFSVITETASVVRRR